MPIPLPFRMPNLRTIRPVWFSVASVPAALVALGTSHATQHWSDVFGALPHSDIGLLACGAALQVCSMEAFIHLQQVALRATGHNVPRKSMRPIAYRGNAISVTVPIGGSALGTNHTVRSLNGLGVPTEAAMSASVLSGLFAAVASIALLLPAIALSARGTGRSAAILGACLAFLVPVAIVVIAKQPRLRVAVAGSDDGRSGPARQAIRSTVTQLATTRLTPAFIVDAFLLAVCNRAADAASLAVAVVAFTSLTPRPEWIVAYAIGLGATSLSLTPAGLGTVEVALATALKAAGVGGSAAWFGAIMYRLIGVGVIASIGWAALATARTSRRPRVNITKDGHRRRLHTAFCR